MFVYEDLHRGKEACPRASFLIGFGCQKVAHNFIASKLHNLKSIFAPMSEYKKSLSMPVKADFRVT